MIRRIAIVAQIAQQLGPARQRHVVRRCAQRYCVHRGFASQTRRAGVHVSPGGDHRGDQRPAK
jgi:hypothetical protein